MADRRIEDYGLIGDSETAALVGINAKKGIMLGNFPQALSHLALINSAYNISEGRGPAETSAKKAPA